MARHNQLGEKGERAALNFLEEQGYQILKTNWREKKFEVDIIAIDKDEIVFVEVKTRSTNNFGNPEEAVDMKKQEHLIEGADHYLQTKEIDMDCRFDVISIIDNGQKTSLTHFKNAFYPEV